MSGGRFNYADSNALKWLESDDRGWYDNLAIKYIEDGKKRWLVKIEFHC